MRTFIKRALWGVLIAGGVTLLGATTAQAAETDGEDGLLSGTQLLAPLSAPIKVVGNALGILGTSTASTPATSQAAGTDAASAATGGKDGVASGSQALITVSVPIAVEGNAISILGTSKSSAQSPAASTSAPTADKTASTSGTRGIVSGTQAIADVDVPVTVTGNAISLLGRSDVTRSGGSTAAAPAGSAADAATDGAGSVLGGTQVVAPVSVPVTVTGNAIAALGTSAVQGGGAAAPAGPGSDILTSGLWSLLGGTQIAAPLSIPLTIGGNAIGVIGDATVDGPPAVPGDDPGDDPGTDPDTDPGDDPGTTPGDTDPGTTPRGGGSSASGSGLAETGGADLAPLGLAALLLLLAGGMLRLRARVN